MQGQGEAALLQLHQGLEAVLATGQTLARLWQGQRKRAAARQVLTEVYGWFTEGFDTADLAEARALLHALG